MTFKVVDCDRMMDNCRNNLPGALDGAIWLEIFNVLHDFFNRTNLWYEDIEFGVSSQTTGDTIDITPSSGRINRLISVKNADDSVRRMTMPEPGVLLFVDAPSQAETWTARCAISVSDPVSTSGTMQGIPQAPDFVLSRYLPGLCAGVIANMMLQVAKPYTNPRMSTFYMRKYMNTLSEAKTEARHQNLYAGQRWSFPLAGIGGRQ